MTNLGTVKRGDTWRFSFVWKNDGTPIDLSDCTAKMQVRKRKDDSLLAEVSDPPDIEIIGVDGKVNVTFPTTVTSTVDPGLHETDLQITFGLTGEVKSSETLTITVVEDITR